MLESLLKGSTQLLIVALLSRLAIFVDGALGVHAADEVVQLRSGEELVVGVLSTRCIESVNKAAD